MPDQNPEYPYNVSGSKPLPPSGQDGPSPSAPQDPQPAPKPELKQEVKEAAAPAKVKRGLPPLLIVGFVLFGFAVAGLLFSLLAKVMAGRRAQTEDPSPVASTVRTVIEEVPVVEEGDVMESQAVVTKARRELPALTLGGILYSEGEGSVALINGKIVPEGGVVKGVTVIRVMSDKVELEFDGRRIFMRSL